ncbi:hypothetical protein PsorP6_005702 [Peronosclerospora sorghi]|uniref:Uncharacterized protein n=1 Tax=Peronosclerospora sorghi TaxID=230839 RepID=A0ACC0W5T7_9STRA|nr:hypothetical protein PsorP6_005702 [Peronosclerospora sorghi]
MYIESHAIPDSWTHEAVKVLTSTFFVPYERLDARATLPASQHAARNIQAVDEHSVVLVCGATGCGKSTQVPQLLLDTWIKRGVGGACEILCTQPRRLAAMGVASRVAYERAEDVADVVGYHIRTDAERSSTTRLLFCTKGILLRRFLSDRTLAGVSHVVVDEGHERTVETDFLLSILRDLLAHLRELRVVLMSGSRIIWYCKPRSLDGPKLLLQLVGAGYSLKCC